MLDIIFISYDEPNADKNFSRLVSRFPHAQRVHGVKGIAAAHIKAAQMSMTKFFYVVDGDAVVLDSFDFSFRPNRAEEGFTHIWYAQNPATGTAYGYGGVKLFSKAFFRGLSPEMAQLDFSTNLTKDIRYHEEIACVTEFNSDPLHAFRGAYREATKLHAIASSVDAPDYMRAEALERLSMWASPIESCQFREHVIKGVHAAIADSKGTENPSFINDLDRMSKVFDEQDGGEREAPAETAVALPTDEFSFITRVSSILYDDFVLKNLPITELRDALSDGQLQSKLWLIRELEKINPSRKSILILGGWIGTLGFLLLEKFPTAKITSVDIDSRANRIAEKLNYDRAFSAIDGDMYSIDCTPYDVIINTSSEHIEDIKRWADNLPRYKTLVVQNNNMKHGDGHVSCVDSASELTDKLTLRKIAYQGKMDFGTFTRFMVIGET